MHALGLGAGSVEHDARRRVLHDKRGDAVSKIVDGDGLEALFRVARQGQHQGEPGKPAHQRRAAMTAAPDYERRFEDQPVRLKARERCIGLDLRPCIGACHIGFGAHGRDMHDALDPGSGARLEQRTRCLSMNAVGIVARGVLQHAHTIHHGVDAGEPWQPLRHLHILVEVAFDPVDVRQDAAAERKIATGADSLHAPPLERRDHLAADEAVSPRH